jgi:two-component system, LytTR family, sensor kinase
MQKRLIRTALFSTPVIALYGVTPLIIFVGVSSKTIFTILFALTLTVSIFWAINLYVLNLMKDRELEWKRYGLSYLITFVIHSGINVLADFLSLRPTEADIFISNFPFFIAYPFLFALAVNTIILIISNSIVLSEKRETAELEIQQLKVTNLEAQKQILLQQLHPHFLFNALSVLKSLIKESPDVAEDYSVKLSEFLRYSAKASEQTTVSLKEELDFTNGYIELQRVRFEGTFSYTVSIPSTALVNKIPVYALQTLVENAFKHNYFTEKNPLHIEINYDNGKLTVTNNKVSLKVTERSGMGLVNLSQRHKLITGKEIDIVETENSFSVTIHLIE